MKILYQSVIYATGVVNGIKKAFALDFWEFGMGERRTETQLRAFFRICRGQTARDLFGAA